MKIKATLCCTVAVCLALTGCATQGPTQDQAKGAALGCGGAVALEVLVGGFSQMAAASCLAGAAAGLTIATLLDEREQKALADARAQAAESNARVEWSAPPPPEPAPAPAEATGSPPAPKPATHTSAPKKPAPKPEPAPSTPASSATVAAKGAATKAPNATAFGWIVPVKTYVGKNGDNCRELQQHAEKGGKKVDENVTMCKTAGVWIVPQKAG